MGLIALVFAVLSGNARASGVTYTYDPLGRLTSVAYGGDGSCQSYAYDAAGNRSTYGSTAGGPPIAINVAVSTNSNFPVTFDPRAGDTSPSCLPLTVTAVGTPAHGTATLGTGGVSVTYTPTTNYGGADSFPYTITDSQSRSSSATISVTVNGVPLNATIDYTTWNWTLDPPAPLYEDPARVVTASGGQIPYTYAWQYVSGQTGMSSTAPTANATQWSYTVGKYQTVSSVWRCQVTDQAGTVAYSPNVTVTFSWIPSGPPG